MNDISLTDAELALISRALRELQQRIASMSPTIANEIDALVNKLNSN